MGGFTFIPFSSPARCLPNTESPQDGLTGGGAAIDLPLIMGVTQEGDTCLQNKKPPAAFKLAGHCRFQSAGRSNWIPFVGFEEKADSYKSYFSQTLV